MSDNPKTNPDPNSNQQKDPDDWVTGNEPMTRANNKPAAKHKAATGTAPKAWSVAVLRGMR